MAARIRRGRKKVALADPNVWVAYLRVSTAEQAESGAGLAAQRTPIEAQAERKGWTIAHWYVDAGLSGKSLDNREQLEQALDDVRNRRATGIIVAKLDRLSRSLADFGTLMEEAHKQGWKINALDIDIDMSTPTGELIATFMAGMARWERRIIGDRTRDALAEKRAAGVRLGRPRTLPIAVIGRIVTACTVGFSYSAIAAALNADKVPTAQGGKCWYPNTVRSVFFSQDGQALLS